MRPVMGQPSTSVPKTTADCCCPLNDGAVPLVVMSDAEARELGLTPLARHVWSGPARSRPSADPVLAEAGRRRGRPLEAELAALAR